jgi:hypothetical protein
LIGTNGPYGTSATGKGAVHSIISGHSIVGLAKSILSGCDAFSEAGGGNEAARNH